MDTDQPAIATQSDRHCNGCDAPIERGTYCIVCKEEIKLAAGQRRSLSWADRLAVVGVLVVLVGLFGGVLWHIITTVSGFGRNK